MTIFENKYLKMVMHSKCEFKLKVICLNKYLFFKTDISLHIYSLKDKVLHFLEHIKF